MFDETERSQHHSRWAQTKPVLIGLTAGLGLGAVATALIAKRTVNRRVSALPKPVKWVVKKIVKSLT